MQAIPQLGLESLTECGVLPPPIRQVCPQQLQLPGQTRFLLARDGVPGRLEQFLLFREYGDDVLRADSWPSRSGRRAHSRFPGHALTPTGVMAIRCKQFHLPDL